MASLVRSYKTLATFLGIISIGWLVIGIGRFREGRSGTGTVDVILCLLFAAAAIVAWRRSSNVASA